VKGTNFIKRIYLLLAALAIAASCAEKSGQDVLSKKEMVEIMEELYIAEEKVNHLTLSRDSAKKVFSVIEARIFKNAAINDTLFNKSFDYYMERPKEMELIYTALVDTLHLREQRAPFRPDQQ
jgi:hypothetical protein